VVSSDPVAMSLRPGQDAQLRGTVWEGRKEKVEGHRTLGEVLCRRRNCVQRLYPYGLEDVVNVSFSIFPYGARCKAASSAAGLAVDGRLGHEAVARRFSFRWPLWGYRRRTS